MKDRERDSIPLTNGGPLKSWQGMSIALFLPHLPNPELARGRLQLRACSLHPPYHSQRLGLGVFCFRALRGPSSPFQLAPQAGGGVVFSCAHSPSIIHDR